MTALKTHWRTALPTVKPLKERHGFLPKASSFEAGTIPVFNQRVFLQFQTTWKEAGYFTINLVIADPEQEIHTVTQNTWDWKPGKKLDHGAHRISHFLGRRHDKWWHLREVERGGWGENPESWTALRLSLREGNWTAESYADETKVIESAVVDVTEDVKAVLSVVGVIPETHQGTT